MISTTLLPRMRDAGAWNADLTLTATFTPTAYRVRSRAAWRKYGGHPSWWTPKQAAYVGQQLMLAGARNPFLLTIQQQQPQRACQLSKSDKVRDQLVRRQVLELKDGDKLVFTKPGYGWARYPSEQPRGHEGVNMLGNMALRRRGRQTARARENGTAEPQGARHNYG